MERRKVKRVPVVSGDQSRRHHHPLRSAAGPGHHPRRHESSGRRPNVSDQAILDKLMAELQDQGFASPKSLDVTVDQGVVTLTGEIFDERQRPALIVAAENIPGVTKVVDQLVWIEPFSGMSVNNARGF